MNAILAARPANAALVRPLSPTETAIWLLDRVAPANFSVAAELHGPLDLETLNRALAAVQTRHPLLAVMIAAVDGRPAFVRPDPAPALRATTTDVADAAWPEAVADELAHRFAADAAPLVRARWLRHAENRGTLTLTFHHAIGDGFSGAYLVRDVLAAYGELAARRGAGLAALPVPAPLERHLPPRVRGWRGLLKFGAETVRKAAAIVRAGGNPGHVADAAPARPAERRPYLVPLSFDRDVTGALLDRCRAERTTVHGALAAALTLAVAPHLDDRRRRPLIAFGSPVNLRDRMDPPVGDDIGLYISLADAFTRLDPEVGFWDLARELRDKTAAAVDRGVPYIVIPGAAQLTRIPGLFGPTPRGIEQMETFCTKMIADVATTGITNLGRLDLPRRVADLDVEAVHFGANPSALGTLAATAASFDGVLRVNLMAMQPNVAAATGRAIVADLRERLLAAARPGA